CPCARGRGRDTPRPVRAAAVARSALAAHAGAHRAGRRSGRPPPTPLRGAPCRGSGVRVGGHHADAGLGGPGQRRGRPRAARGCGPRVSLSSPRPPVAWRAVVPVAVAQFAVLLALANRYGYHRDELYFRVAARHPSVAYEDQGALTPLLGRLSE